MKNSDFYLQLIKKSGCPVIERPLECSAGWYYPPNCCVNKKYGDGAIEIKKDMTSSEKIGTLAHEMGHERCNRRKCICSKKPTFLSEVHAELYALHLLLRSKQKNAIKARFERLQIDWAHRRLYRVAKHTIRKRRIYERCLVFITKKEKR